MMRAQPGSYDKPNAAGTLPLACAANISGTESNIKTIEQAHTGAPQCGKCEHIYTQYEERYL